MAKSIIDLEIKDDAFKRFLGLYAQFQEQVKDLPGAWGQVDAGVGVTAATFGAMTEALISQKIILQEFEKAQRKQQDNEKRLLDTENKRKATLHSMWLDTQNMAKTVANITVDLFKWVGVGGILSGLAGAGGLWGLDQLANRVSDARRSAQGLGVSTGQQQALNINYQRYLDVNSGLENIAGAKSDLSRSWAFNAMGVSGWQTKDPATLMVEMATKAKAIFDRGGGTEQEARAHGLLEFYTMDELRRLHSLSMRDLREAQSGYGRDAAAFGLSDETSKKWQLFSVQMARAGRSIENVFVDALTPLTPELTKLSETVAETVKTFLTDPNMKDWIQDFGEGIKKVAAYMESPKFQADIHNFMSDFGALASWVHDRLVQLHIIPANWATDAAGNPAYDNPAAAAANSAPGMGDAAEAAALARSRRAVAGLAAGAVRQGAIEGYFEKTGWTRNQAAGVTANIWQESAGNPFALGDYNKAGQATAYGIGQWHKERQANYTKLFGHTMQSVTDFRTAMAEQLRFVNWELSHTFARAGQMLKAQRSAREAGEAASVWYERPRDVAGEARRRGAAAQVLVTIINQTGAHVAVQASQLPQ